MEKYNKHIAKLPNVEFIHISLDQSDEAAEDWAAKEQFPWLTILPDKVERSGMEDYKTNDSVPEYHLIDAEGNTIVKGDPLGADAFAKIDELAKESK